MPRRSLLTLIAAVSIAAAVHAIAFTAAPAPAPGRTVQVPFDYHDSGAGTFRLYYELGKPYDPAKRTVFVVADGQQFYVRQGAVAGIQDDIFGTGFNVVGIVGRGTNHAVLSRISHGGSIDWLQAWKLLRSENWVEDLERVRRDIVGTEGRVSLYGRSGGGLLVHQYLSKYGRHVQTVFTQAAVNRFIDAELGISSDTFWDDIGRSDQALRNDLLQAIARHQEDRSRIMLLLQRQNFFVGASDIASKRAALIHALASWDTAALDGYTHEYQVDAMLSLLKDPQPATNVRIYELFAPILGTRSDGVTSRVDPDIEVGRLFGAPLFALLRDGRIAAPAMDLNALYRVPATVYILAGRFDHTADYRSQIALAAHYPKHRLLLLADDHDFLALQKTGLYPALVQAALRGGVRAAAVTDVEARLGTLVYREY